MCCFVAGEAGVDCGVEAGVALGVAAGALAAVLGDAAVREASGCEVVVAEGAVLGVELTAAGGDYLVGDRVELRVVVDVVLPDHS